MRTTVRATIAATTKARLLIPRRYPVGRVCNRDPDVDEWFIPDDAVSAS